MVLIGIMIFLKEEYNFIKILSGFGFRFYSEVCEGTSGKNCPWTYL